MVEEECVDVPSRGEALEVCTDQLTRWPRDWLGSFTQSYITVEVPACLRNDENINLQSLYAAVRMSSGSGG